MNTQEIKNKIKKNKYIFFPLALANYLITSTIKSRLIFSDIIYSVCYYKKFNIQTSNHFTIGIKKLALARTQLPHPVGIVIGKGVTLGDDCKIYQNVTIGLRRDSDDKYPRIGNNVTIYANSIIIGGIEIGENSIIGASSVITQDIPPNSIVAGSPGKVVKKIE